MANTRDYYAVLGVPRSASQREIQSAYRRLARQYHPDVAGGDADSERRFKEVNEAYEVLGTEKHRAAYDRWGDQWEHAEQLEQMQADRGSGFGSGGFGGGFPGGGFAPGGTRVHWQSSGGDADPFADAGGGFGGIFDRLFRHGAEPQTGQTLEHAVTVSLHEAYAGTTRTVQLQTGDRPAAKRLEVTIPPGVETGSRIRLSGKGPPGRGGGPPGDVILVVTVNEDPRFERRGTALHVDVPVPLTTAVLGGEVEVPTLSGAVALRIPAGTQNGRVFRLSGKGMPVLHQDKRGDLFARVRVVLPETITPKMRELFEQLRDLDSAPRTSTA